MEKRIEGQNYWRNGFENGCPDCGSIWFLDGPHGGLSINFMCGICGSKFNDMGSLGIENI